MRNIKPSNLDDLFDNYLHKLVESMPRRCQAVIDAKGIATCNYD